MAPTAPPQKAWALLAYTVADDKGSGDSIDSAAKDELKAISEAADFGHVSVAAQVDFKYTRGAYRGTLTDIAPPAHQAQDVPSKYPLWQAIVDHLQRSTLTVEIQPKELDAAHACVLRSFLDYGRHACRARRHMIYFYGHGYGPMGLFYDSARNDRPAHTLRLNDLADSLHTSGHRASLILFRDCYMNTLEAAYQLKDVAQFMIASQAEAPIAGIWPWKKFLDELRRVRQSRTVARAVATHLGEFLDEPVNRDPFADVPISLLDLREADKIVVPLKDLTNALVAARGDAACAKALEGARVGYPDSPTTAPGDPALLDVPTMCDNLQLVSQAPVKEAAAALGLVVRDRLVTTHHSQKSVYRGTSIYYKPVHPDDTRRSHIQQDDPADAEKDAVSYRELALNKATGWHRIALNPLT